MSAEEGPSADKNPANNNNNDEPDNNTNSSVDTDDITLVVPLDFARGENVDDGVFTTKEDDEKDDDEYDVELSNFS